MIEKQFFLKTIIPVFFFFYLFLLENQKRLVFIRVAMEVYLTGLNLLKFQITFPFRSTSSKVSLYLEQESKESSSSI